MTYTVRQHHGLRTSMAHLHTGTEGSFYSLSDAVAWASFKHDGINNTFVCLDNGDVIYGIVPAGSDYWTDAYKKHEAENPWLAWSTKHYKLQVVK